IKKSSSHLLFCNILMVFFLFSFFAFLSCCNNVLGYSLLCSRGFFPETISCIAPLYFGFQWGWPMTGEYVHRRLVLSKDFSAPAGRIVSINNIFAFLLSLLNGMFFILNRLK